MTGDEVAREGMVGHRGTATATFLFCDLVGSTDLLTRLGDDAGDEVRRSCYSALRRTIDGTGGREIKSTGDGFLVVFPSSVGDATACGVEMQRALARLDRSHPLARLGLRVGISVGEAVNEDGDWYGTPVVEAARLCAAARSGQILVADLVPALVGSRGGHRFASLGTMDLKGLEPLAVSEVAWEPEGTPVVLPMPSSLDAAANEAMVDRWREREVVLTAWRAATGGRPAVVLLTGEAGIGRTRLAAEVARTVHADGAAVLYGRCREEVGRPYEPFSEALSWYAGVCPPDELGLQLGAAAGELVRLVPGLASRLPDLPAPSSGRERLLDAVATVLDAIAASRPTLLVLDDLHLATPPTIAMLARVVESAGGRPLLVLATACDGLPGADVGDDLLTELRRHGDTEHVPLTGLDDAAVAELLTRATGPGEHVDQDRAAALRAESEGNPAILIRLVREAAAGGAGILECPYMGLAPFQPEDGGLFFGRDDIVDGLLSRLAQSRVLGLVGASGSGKSSVIRAGVLPAIWRGALPSSAAWRVVIMAPGRHPLAELAAKVALLEHASPSRLLRDLEDDPRTLDLTTRQLLDGVNPDARVLLVVDQLEELFTICEQPSERQAFVDAVVHAVTVPGGRTAVLTAIRADFYGHVAFDERLAGALESNHVLLGPLREEDLRAAIERPAAAVGLRLEPGLVDLVVHDVEEQPGALPLVSHAMAETWKHRRGRTLTIAGYRETGGVRGALATTAEAVYAVLARDEQQVAKRLLLRLIEVGDGSEDTARRARREELDDGDDAVVGRVLNRLVEARLLLADDTSVEIAHEALIRAWPRLTAWLDEDRNQLRVYGHLRDSARAWERSGHDDSELYRGARLAAVLDLVGGGEAGLDGLERDFLAACRAREEADLRAAEQRAVTARRANRRLRGLLSATAVLLVVAVVAGAVALDRQADAAAARRLADARRVGAAAQVEQAVDKALLLAVAGVQLEATADTRANLLATLDRSADVISVTRFDLPLEGLAMSPVGDRLVVGDVRTGLYAIDPAGEGRDTTDTVAGIKTRTMEYVPTGGELLAVFDGPFWGDNQIGLADADTLQPTGPMFTGYNGPNLYDVAADPAGRFIVAAGDSYPDGHVVLVVWDRDHPEAPRLQIELPGAGLGGIALSPDGSLLHVTTSDGHVAYDTATWTPGGGFHAEGPLAVAPDGRVAAVTEFYDGPGRRVGIFRPSGELVVELVGHQAQVNAVAFAPAGDMVATASDDETVAVWNPATGDRIDLFQGHSDRVAALAFSADGETLYSAGFDGALIAWDLSGRQGLARQVREPFGPSDPVEFALPMAGEGSVYVLPDQSLIVRSADGIAVGPVGAEFGPVAWSDVAPDGSRIAVVGRLGEAVVLDGQTLEERARGATSQSENLGAIAFGPEGDTFVVAAVDGVVREYTAGSVEETGRVAPVAPWVPIGVRRAGPDTAVVLAHGPTDDVPALVAVDLESGETSAVVELPGMSISTAAIDPTGRLGAVGSQDGRIVVLDLVTGEAIGPPVAAHVGPVATIAFAPDGGELISSGFDGRLAFWDAATGDLLGTVRPGPENLFARARYRDADTIVVAYEDGSVYEFDRDPAAWIERACLLAGRDLTEEEWRDAFDDRPYRPTCPQD